VIDGIFCVDMRVTIQTGDPFQPSRLSGVRLWAAITLYTLSLWWEIWGWSRLWNNRLFQFLSDFEVSRFSSSSVFIHFIPFLFSSVMVRWTDGTMVLVRF